MVGIAEALSHTDLCVLLSDSWLLLGDSIRQWHSFGQSWGWKTCQMNALTLMCQGSRVTSDEL